MRGIDLLHPKMKIKIEELAALCVKNGLPLLITETWRTTEEQNALYAQGRDKNGNIIGMIVTNAKGDSYQSGHQWGVCADFCRNVKGKEYDTSDGFFHKVGTLAKSIGLVWGGDFKSIIDMPHLELPEFMPNNSTSMLKSKYGTPGKFKATWSTVTPVPSGLPVLRTGSKGQSVKDMQSALVKNGFMLPKHGADGIFGAETELAVKAFQKVKKLSADGICGPATWAALGVT